MTDTTAPATETATLVDTHLAAYAEPDRTRRTELLAQVWADDDQLLDPPFDGTGVAGIADLVDTVLANQAAGLLTALLPPTPRPSPPSEPSPPPDPAPDSTPLHEVGVDVR